MYKNIRDIVTFGDLYRLTDACSNTYAAWMYVSGDKSRAVVTVVTTVRHAGEPRKRICLKGLDENAAYICGGKEYSGSTLMNVGIEHISCNDYDSKVMIFEKKTEKN